MLFELKEPEIEYIIQLIPAPVSNFSAHNYSDLNSLRHKFKLREDDIVIY